MSHYFTDPHGASAPTRVSTILGGRSVELMTDRGVFSRDGLDLGTKVLLDTVPPPPRQGHFLDLGCGYGPIAITMAMASPEAKVWAVDVNSRARELCEKNCQELGIENIRVGAPDDVRGDISFSCIWSNPPIRVGKKAVHEILARWLDRLDVAGTAHLVVQRHLGADSLHAWLSSSGWDTTRVLSRKAYRVLRVTARPRPPHDRESR